LKGKVFSYFQPLKKYSFYFINFLTGNKGELGCDGDKGNKGINHYSYKGKSVFSIRNKGVV